MSGLSGLCRVSSAVGVRAAARGSNFVDQPERHEVPQIPKGGLTDGPG